MITRLNIGGPARQALFLTRAMAPRYATTLVAGTPDDVEGELVDPAVAVTRVRLVRQVSPAADAAALAQVAGVVRRRRPVIVHTHMAKAGTVGRLAARAVRPRPLTVHTFHGHVLDGYFRPAVARVFVATERALARLSDLLIAVSDEVRDALLELGIGEPHQYRVVPLGLQLSEHLAVAGPSGVLRPKLGLPASAPVVGVVGRLAPVKNVDLLLEAVARVGDCQLVVMGDGPERARLEQLAAGLGLSGRVHFTGWWHDIPAAMADMDVVALSSVNEGTPVSLIEAAACARPVVATAVGGVPSVVADGRSGVLVPSGDVEALARGIESLLGDAGRAAAMGEWARRNVAPRYSATRLLSDMTAVYDELVDRR
ncbi:MAG TPA: glycosyltransferase [Acidimicrobiales bacterium]|nr:glycosyltransferase [Acidimicrobiales bacterium]